MQPHERDSWVMRNILSFLKTDHTLEEGIDDSVLTALVVKNTYSKENTVLVYSDQPVQIIIIDSHYIQYGMLNYYSSYL